MPDIDIDFCERTARRGHRVRDAQVRPRERRPDHHLRHDGGQGRRSATWAACSTSPTPRSTGSPSWCPPALDMTLDEGARREPRAQGSYATATRASGELLETGPAPRGPDPPRLDPRRRRRHRARAAHRVRAAVQGSPRRDHDAVGHEGDREDRPAQDGLPRAEHADADRRRAQAIARTTGETVDLDAIPLDDARTFELFAEGQTAGVFQFESAGMRDMLRKAASRSASTTSSRSTRSTAPGRSGRA